MMRRSRWRLKTSRIGTRFFQITQPRSPKARRIREPLTARARYGCLDDFDMNPGSLGWERGWGGDDRPRLRSDQSVPFVEGTPSPRGSRSQAIRSERARPLKIASLMWWLFRP